MTQEGPRLTLWRQADGEDDWTATHGERLALVAVDDRLEVLPLDGDARPAGCVACLVGAGTQAALVLQPGWRPNPPLVVDGREAIGRLAALHDRSVLRAAGQRMVLAIGRADGAQRGLCAVSGTAGPVRRCASCSALIGESCLESLCHPADCPLCGGAFAEASADWRPEALFGEAEETR